jgi:hypothetical protein
MPGPYLWVVVMMTLAPLFADAIVVLHVAFVAFVAAGGLLVWRWPRLAWLHLPCAIWGAAVSFGGWICPLTPLENHLRLRAGEAGYSGDFVARYLLPVLYPEGLTREAQVVLGALVVVVNAAVYGLAWRRARRPSRPPVQGARPDAG